MIKDFIPYKQALELKKLGFNELCMKMEYHYMDPYTNWHVPNELDCPIPLYQQAFRWFRKKYKIDVIIQPNYSTKYEYRIFYVENQSKRQYYGDYMSKQFNTYEKAEFASLIKLIEIVNNKTRLKINNYDTDSSRMVNRGNA